MASKSRTGLHKLTISLTPANAAEWDNLASVFGLSRNEYLKASTLVWLDKLPDDFWLLTYEKKKQILRDN